MKRLFQLNASFQLITPFIKNFSHKKRTNENFPRSYVSLRQDVICEKWFRAIPSTRLTADFSQSGRFVNTHRPTARRHILPLQSRAKQNLATINYACFLIFQVEHKLNWSFVRFIFIARLFSVPSLSTSFFLPIEIIEFVNFFISHNSSSFAFPKLLVQNIINITNQFLTCSAQLYFSFSLSSPFWQKQKTLHAIKNKLGDKYLSENFVFVSTI